MGGGALREARWRRGGEWPRRVVWAGSAAVEVLAVAWMTAGTAETPARMGDVAVACETAQADAEARVACAISGDEAIH